LIGSLAGYRACVHPDSTEQKFPPDEVTRDRLAGEVSELAREQRLSIGVAESLTGGMVASALAAAEAASQWFRGSLVAYSSEVKHEVLGVPPGPVVSAEAAEAMARGVGRLLGADVAVAVTGAGGPDPQDGQEPGTIFVGVDNGTDVQVHELYLDGDPQAICMTAAETTLRVLLEALRSRR
jgi:nicotinamide-nucleotide amidase